jgi:hypothetical protein
MICSFQCVVNPSCLHFFFGRWNIPESPKRRPFGFRTWLLCAIAGKGEKHVPAGNSRDRRPITKTEGWRWEHGLTRADNNTGGDVGTVGSRMAHVRVPQQLWHANIHYCARRCGASLWHGKHAHVQTESRECHSVSPGLHSSPSPCACEHVACARGSCHHRRMGSPPPHCTWRAQPDVPHYDCTYLPNARTHHLTHSACRGTVKEQTPA